MQILDMGVRKNRNGMKWGNKEDRVGLPNPVVLDNGDVIVLYNWSKFVNNHNQRGCRKVFFKRSRDQGKTWTRPKEITGQVQRKCKENRKGVIKKNGQYGWSGLGPAHGILLKNPKFKNRIIIAARQNRKVEVSGKKKFITYSYIIYADPPNRSKTWKGVNWDNVVWNMGEFQKLRSSEVAVVELNDGRVMLNSRSPGAERYRTVGISNDGGISFKQCNSYVDKQLFEAPGGVQGSMLNVDGKILFSNPRSKKARTSNSIQISEDNGLTWNRYLQYVKKGQYSSYSDMVELSNGSIGILFQWGPVKKKKHYAIKFLTISKEDLN